MRTIILFIAILIASLLAARNHHAHNTKETFRKTDSKFNESKSTIKAVPLKKSRSKIATFYSFYVL